MNATQSRIFAGERIDDVNTILCVVMEHVYNKMLHMSTQRHVHGSEDYRLENVQFTNEYKECLRPPGSVITSRHQQLAYQAVGRNIAA